MPIPTSLRTPLAIMLVFPRRHSREGALLSGENMDSLARHRGAGFSPAISVLPIRHSSESWNRASFTLCKSLDPSFRWDDGIFGLPARSAYFPRTAMRLGGSDSRAE